MNINDIQEVITNVRRNITEIVMGSKVKYYNDNNEINNNSKTLVTKMVKNDFFTFDHFIESELVERTSIIQNGEKIGFFGDIDKVEVRQDGKFVLEYTITENKKLDEINFTNELINKVSNTDGNLMKNIIEHNELSVVERKIKTDKRFKITESIIQHEEVLNLYRIGNEFQTKRYYAFKYNPDTTIYKNHIKIFFELTENEKNLDYDSVVNRIKEEIENSQSEIKVFYSKPKNLHETSIVTFDSDKADKIIYVDGKVQVASDFLDYILERRPNWKTEILEMTKGHLSLYVNLLNHAYIKGMDLDESIRGKCVSTKLDLDVIYGKEIYNIRDLLKGGEDKVDEFISKHFIYHKVIIDENTVDDDGNEIMKISLIDLVMERTRILDIVNGELIEVTHLM